jgi:hypothetical protein
MYEKTNLMSFRFGRFDADGDLKIPGGMVCRWSDSSVSSIYAENTTLQKRLYIGKEKGLWFPTAKL